MACSSQASPFRLGAKGVRIAVRLTPRASRDRIQGVVSDAAGAASLKVAVTAAPEAGKANQALIGLLAKEWGVPKTSLTVVAGASERKKTLELAGAPETLLARLKNWLGGSDG